MGDALKSAIEAFAENHNRNFPTNFIIYRDGLGDAQQKQSLDKEVSQFKKVFEEIYNKAGPLPKVTLIVVNKRITQRFFIQDNKGVLMNPPSGCIVDRGLVVSSGSEE